MLLLIATFLMAHANEKHAADLYDLEGKTKLFTFEAERTDMGGGVTSYTGVYKDLNGQIAAQEKGQYDKDGVFMNYEASRPPLEEKGSVEVKDGKINFSYSEKNETKTSKDNFDKGTLFSGTLVPYLQKHIDDLLAKKDLSFRYVVWYRKETVGFKFVFDKEENGQIIAKMVPTNMLYRSLVDPLYFSLDKATKKLIFIKGRTMPKIKDGSKWKNVDSFVKYH